MTTRERHNRIRRDLRTLQEAGVIERAYTYNPGGNFRWVFTAAGWSERSFTTEQMECFIFGAMAAIQSAKDAKRRAECECDDCRHRAAIEGIFNA